MYYLKYNYRYLIIIIKVIRYFKLNFKYGKDNMEVYQKPDDSHDDCTHWIGKI